ncbi:MAG: SIR2 family protein [Nitrospirae bacterium]|nr:SIR2 family protein [Magnetococcales bacterium]
MDMFLIGAGACVPLGLSTTQGFMTSFNPSPDTRLLFDVLLAQLADNDKSRLDIERIFFVLENLIKNHKTYINTATLFEETYRKKMGDSTSPEMKSGFDSKRNYSASAKYFLGDLYSMAIVLDRELKRFLWDSLKHDRQKAFELFSGLFSPLLQRQDSLTIFTTNYDLVLESVFEDVNRESGLKKHWEDLGIHEIYNGFECRGSSLVHTRNLDANRPAAHEVGYFKLHGSLTWDFHDGVCITGAPRMPEDLNGPALIYPGYKGIPVDHPFSDLHRHFFNRLAVHKRLISIGFAYRDELINSLIATSLTLRPKLQVHAICPEFPEDSNFPMLARQFPEQVFHHREKFGEKDLLALIPPPPAE